MRRCLVLVGEARRIVNDSSYIVVLLPWHQLTYLLLYTKRRCNRRKAISSLFKRGTILSGSVSYIRVFHTVYKNGYLQQHVQECVVVAILTAALSQLYSGKTNKTGSEI